MRSLGGYGRYDDDPTYVGCPRAKSDMTPCIVRDGEMALEDRHEGEIDRCVGCRANPVELLSELLNEIRRQPPEDRPSMHQATYWLKSVVWAITEPRLMARIDEYRPDES